MEWKKVFDYERFNLNSEDFSRKDISEVTNYLLNSFTFVKAYHATKIYPFDDFAVGLLPITLKDQKERLKKIILPEYPKYAESIVKIIDGTNFKYYENLYYVISREVFNKAYHYHRYGSENFLRIVDNISKEIPEFKGRQLLKETGKPTTIHFLIRFSDLKEDELREISEYLITNNNGLGFCHKKKIPANQIIKFEDVPLPWNSKNFPE